MSDTVIRSPLHAYVFARFREVFGQPNNSLQRDDHWALQTLIVDKPINILVNGTPASPAVWVFDPYELANPVYNTALADESAVDGVIVLIQGRVTKAGQPAVVDDSALGRADADSTRKASA